MHLAWRTAIAGEAHDAASVEGAIDCDLRPERIETTVEDQVLALVTAFGDLMQRDHGAPVEIAQRYHLRSSFLPHERDQLDRRAPIGREIDRPLGEGAGGVLRLGIRCFETEEENADGSFEGKNEGEWIRRSIGATRNEIVRMRAERAWMGLAVRSAEGICGVG